MWRKAMLYLGLGPDDEYDDYDDEPERRGRRQPAHRGPARGRRRQPSRPYRQPPRAPGAAVADRRRASSRSAAVPARRPVGGHRRHHARPCDAQAVRPDRRAADGQAPRRRAHVVQRGPGGGRQVQGRASR